jgi:hypothetical protein
MQMRSFCQFLSYNIIFLQKINEQKHMDDLVRPGSRLDLTLKCQSSTKKPSDDVLDNDINW